MQDIWFDHFITYTNADNVDDYLQAYARQGFLPDEKTVRHDPGLRNRFIFIGPEYIEFCWVEDEGLFSEADADQKLFRAASRPFGIGMIAKDIYALHANWVARGLSIPEIWSKAPRDASPDAAPLWSFQDIPAELSPGASCFALTYHTRPKGTVRQVAIHPNSIYGLSGVTFVAADPHSRALCWRNLLSPDEPVAPSEAGYQVQIGPHQVQWITPEAYQAVYRLGWAPASHSSGELGLLHLLANNLDTAKQMVEQSGRDVTLIRINNLDGVLIAPDARDGFIFYVQEYPGERWIEERMARTGERLELSQV